MTSRGFTATEAERRAYAAGARKVEEERDMRSMERIATALERIAKCMEKREQKQNE